MNAEEWAIDEARTAYAEGRIDVDELERRIETALTDPPKPPWYSPFGRPDTDYIVR